MSGFDFAAMDGSVERLARAAHDHGFLEEPEHETMACACGYEGPPEAIVRYSEWDLSDEDRDLFVCAGCGGA